MVNREKKNLMCVCVVQEAMFGPLLLFICTNLLRLVIRHHQTAFLTSSG